MTHLRIVVALSVGLIASACVTTTKTEVISSPFDRAAMAYFKERGTGTIEGQAFLRQVGGGVVTAAGEPVVLFPAVAYTDEMVAKASSEIAKGPYAATVEFVNQDPALRDEYTRRTIADATGSFVFDDLAAGDYYILTQVRWEVPARYGRNPQGGQLVQRVSVQSDQTKRVILTR